MSIAVVEQPPATGLCNVRPGHPLRAASEALVRDTYRRRYGATLGRLPDRLVVICNPTGRPVAAAAVLDAGTGFLSQSYLDRPVAAAVAERLGRPVDPLDLVEVSSLASGVAGAGSRLLHGLIGQAVGEGRRAGVCTATAELRACLARLGLAVLPIAAADPARRADAWRYGTYYELDPWVVALAGGPGRAA